MPTATENFTRSGVKKKKSEEMTKTKTCNKCGITYEHYGHNVGWCRPCGRLYYVEYNINKSPEARKRQKVRSDARRRENFEKFNTWKGAIGCCRCPESDPDCLDMHHVDPAQKDEAVAEGVKRGWAWGRLMKEAEKCIVICANCHRKLHAKLRREETTPL